MQIKAFNPFLMNNHLTSAGQQLSNTLVVTRLHFSSSSLSSWYFFGLQFGMILTVSDQVLKQYRRPVDHDRSEIIRFDAVRD